MSDSERISISNGQLTVPNNPEINYIEGDGIGIDITPVMIDVVDSAVETAYKGTKKISWMEVFCVKNLLKYMTQIHGCLMKLLKHAMSF